HRHAHRLKVFWADEIEVDNWRRLRLKRRTPLDLNSLHAERRPRERERTGQAGRLDAGQTPDAIERFLEISAALWPSTRVSGVAGIHRERQYSIGIEAFWDSHQTQKALGHQPRAGEQDQSERQFGDHQGR